MIGMAKNDSDQKINEQNEETFRQLLMNLTEIVKDNNKVALLTEILINETITVNELKNKPSIKNSMKKSLLYARLKDLESQGFITSEYEVQTTEEDRGYAVKKFSMSKDFITLIDEKLPEYSKELPRELRLFGLYMIQSFLLRERDRILNLTNDQINDNPNEIRGGYGGLVTLTKEEFKFVQQKMNELNKELKEKFPQENEDRGFQTYGMYYGFYYLPEKDDSN